MPRIDSNIHQSAVPVNQHSQQPMHLVMGGTRQTPEDWNSGDANNQNPGGNLPFDVASFHTSKFNIPKVHALDAANQGVIFTGPAMAGQLSAPPDAETVASLVSEPQGTPLLAMTAGPYPAGRPSIEGVSRLSSYDGTQTIAQVASRNGSGTNGKEYFIAGVASVDNLFGTAVRGFSQTEVVLRGAKTRDQALKLAADYMEAGAPVVANAAMPIFEPGREVTPFNPYFQPDRIVHGVLNSETVAVSGLAKYNFREFDPGHHYRDIFNNVIYPFMKNEETIGNIVPRTASGAQLINNIGQELGLKKSGNFLSNLAPWTANYSGAELARIEKIANAMKQVGGESPQYSIRAVFQIMNDDVSQTQLQDLDVRAHGFFVVKEPGGSGAYKLISGEGSIFPIEDIYHQVRNGDLVQDKITLIPIIADQLKDDEGRYQFVMHRF